MRERNIDHPCHLTFESIESFLSAHIGESSVISIYHGGFPIDIRVDYRGFDCTLVLFQAALPANITKLPVFTAANITEDLACNRLFIADPSLYVHDDLTLAWYSGNRFQIDLQDLVPQIIRSLVPQGDRLVTFGASGGGFASMLYAPLINADLSIAINPQVRLADYVPGPLNRWLKYGWGLDPRNTTVEDLPVLTDSGKHFRESNDTKLWYVQNTGDLNHVNNHYLPFLDSLPLSNSVSPIPIDVGPGHVPPSKPDLRRILDCAVNGDSHLPPRL